MLRVFQHHISVIALLQLVADAILCVAAVLLARAHLQPIDTAQLGYLYPPGDPLPILAFTLLMPFLYLAVGSYRRATADGGISASLARPFIALLIGATIGYVALKASHSADYAGQFAAALILYMGAGILLVRGLVLVATRYSIGATRVLIVGAGTDAREIAADLMSGSSGQVKMIGFYAIDGDDAEISDSPPVFPKHLSLQELVERHRVDELIVATGERRGAVPMEQLLACRILGIPVLDRAAFYERVRGEVPTNSLRASWLVYGNGFSQSALRQASKRLFDIMTSAVLLVIASPIMVLAAVAIRMEGSGPITYTQQRIGLRGREFTCIKFRSMTIDAERDGVARWATKNDSRITRVGSLLRKTRIDELPQLWSVLCGEMSMVGPRPERPCFVSELRERIPFYDIRHSVKPGLTGWAQVRYKYGASVEDAERKHHFDLYYIKNNSVFLDLLILLETVSVVIFREGAQ